MADNRPSIIDQLLEEPYRPMAQPRTRLGLFETPDWSSETDQRIVQMMRTGGVMLAPVRITDEEIASLKEVMGANADIRRVPQMGGRGVEFYSHAQAIKFGLLPPDKEDASTA